MGWQPTHDPSPPKTWAEELTDLYIRSDMETEEYDRLMTTAMRDERPDHPDLPAYRSLGHTLVWR